MAHCNKRIGKEYYTGRVSTMDLQISARGRKYPPLVEEHAVPTPQRDPNHDWACVRVSNGFRCGFCSMSLLCLGGNAYRQPCPPDTSCTHRPDFGAVCHTDIPTQCQCRSANELQPDPYNPASFIVCTSISASPRRIEMCPTGYFFNMSTTTCQRMPAFPPCIMIGTFPLTSDCQWYYTCTIDSTGNWMHIPAKCMTPGYVYSISVSGCAHPRFLAPTDQCLVRSTKARSSYVCTLLGYLIGTIFPSLVKTFCTKL